MVWFADEFAKHETIDAFRKGVCYVEDIGGFTLANLDTGNSKHLVDAFQVQNKVIWNPLQIADFYFQHKFPQKITHMYVINPGIIFKFLIGFAKLIVKKKIISRVNKEKKGWKKFSIASPKQPQTKAMTIEQLHQEVEKDQLVEEFGGTLSSEDIFPMKPFNPEVK